MFPVPGTFPAAAQSRKRQVRSEFPAAEPHRTACACLTGGQSSGVTGDLVLIRSAAAFPDQCPGVPEPGEEVLLADGCRCRFLDHAAERDPGRFLLGQALCLLGFSAGRADRRSAVCGSRDGKAELPLDRLARRAGTEEVVVDARQGAILSGEGRGDMNVVDAAGGPAVPDRHPADAVRVAMRG